MTIIVIGKSGQLASELSCLNNMNQNIIALGRYDIDIFDVESMCIILKERGARAVINTAAYTAVDKAESEIENVYALNETGSKNVAHACSLLNIYLVHISTDFVFDGQNTSPYLPSNLCNPMSAYGKSKRAGEKAVLETLPDSSCVLRTSWVYSRFGNNFLKTMLKLMTERDELDVVGDQIGTPTNASGLANACMQIVTYRLVGTHHYTDAGLASWYDFAEAIYEIGIELGMLNKTISLKPISTSEYPTAAMRPAYSVLDKTSLLEAMPSIVLFHWRDQLRAMMKTMKTN
jgi:dTDP-4-dehydrorhamnose reductase